MVRIEKGQDYFVGESINPTGSARIGGPRVAKHMRTTARGRLVRLLAGPVIIRKDSCKRYGNTETASNQTETRYEQEPLTSTHIFL